jgi:hypothetical protein
MKHLKQNNKHLRKQGWETETAHLYTLPGPKNQAPTHHKIPPLTTKQGSYLKTDQDKEDEDCSVEY